MDDLLDLHEVVAAPATRFTQTWDPSVETEHFTTDRWGVLSRLAVEQDVRISVETSNDASCRIRVSGTSQGCVQAAIAKIAALEKSLVRLTSLGLLWLCILMIFHNFRSFSNDPIGG